MWMSVHFGNLKWSIEYSHCLGTCLLYSNWPPLMDHWIYRWQCIDHRDNGGLPGRIYLLYHDKIYIFIIKKLFLKKRFIYNKLTIDTIFSSWKTIRDLTDTRIQYENGLVEFLDWTEVIPIDQQHLGVWFFIQKSMTIESHHLHHIHRQRSLVQLNNTKTADHPVPEQDSIVPSIEFDHWHFDRAQWQDHWLIGVRWISVD